MKNIKHTVLDFFGKKNHLILSLLFMMVMFVLTMYIVNPAIDSQNGSGILALQLAFDKELGIEIINGWGAKGIETYNRWYFVDYLYAVSYSVFLASLLSFLIYRKNIENSSVLKTIPLIALAAGACDWLENTLEFIFIQNPAIFSSHLFFFHSIVAVVKWIAVLIAVVSVIYLLIRPVQGGGGTKSDTSVGKSEESG